MAAAPIDLSSGLVPKTPAVDLSAGLVPKATPDTRNSFQKFVDGAIDYAEHPEKRGEQANPNMTQFVGGALRGSIGVLAHPVDALESLGQTIAHPIDTTKATVQQAIAHPAQAAGNVVGGIALGEAAAPIADTAASLATKTGGRAVLLGRTPEAAYESALKPSTTLPASQRAAVVKTGLDNSIPISKGGLERISDLIDGYNQQIKSLINSDPTRPIDPNKVATRADLAKAKFAKQVNAQPDLNAIESSKQQFLAEQGAKPAIPPQPTGVLDAQGRPIMTAGTPATPAQPMNAADAQAMKQGTYQVLRGKYGEQGSASVEAQKALARGLKEEIATQFPEITKLNSSESRLLDLQPILERAVNRTANHQLIGIGTPIAGEAAKAVTGSGGVGAVASVMKAVLDNPAVKSRLAIAVSKGAKIPYSQAAARVAAYSSALQSAGQSQPDTSGASQ